ncbi:MAG: hypothetical protein AB1435_17525 [Chloroflexota bacterium]|jgi:hypothetical protein
MDLEQRVTMLEQELQILKNQIQATLLDIQEHLLTNTYPSLRAEARPETAPVKTVSAKPAAPAEPEGEPAPLTDQPLVRQVSLKDVKAQEPPAPSRAPERSPENPPLQDSRPHGATEPDSVSGQPKPGANAAPGSHRAAPSSYRKNGDTPGPRVTPFIVDDDFPPPAAADDTPISEADWAILGQLEEWTIRRVNKFGPRRTRELIKQYAAEGRIAPNIKDSLLQLVSIIVGETTLQSSNGGYLVPAREPIPPKQADSPSYNGASPQPPQEGDGDVSPNLILRLIAGIATLGTNNSRSRDHG